MRKKSSKNLNGGCKIPTSYDISSDILEEVKKRMSEDVEDAARLFKTLSDPARLRILRALDVGEMCACVLVETADCRYSALSYHLKMLKDAGLIKSKRDGNFLNYSLTEKGKKVLKGIKYRGLSGAAKRKKGMHAGEGN